MFHVKPKALTLALATAGLWSGSIYAQQANGQTEQDAIAEQDSDIEVISVTGFRRSLIDSINTKRFSDTVSEQLSADDLGALPDVSMADALTRLPGVSAVRTGGQAAEINIRGMSGGFVFSTLNGREQVSTKGERSIEYDQYPSELISSAAVYKSPKVSHIEGGVAGTVELKTASPLAISEDYKINLNARGMYNDRASSVADANEYGYRLSGSYQAKFLQDTLGVAVGYSRLYQPSVSEQFVGLQYNAEDTDNPGYYFSEGMELQHRGGEETRDGYMLVLEYQPHDDVKLKFDGFWSKFDTEAFARGYRVKLEANSAATANLTTVPYGDGNFSYIGGTFNRTTNGNTRVEITNDDNTDSDKVRSVGLNLDWLITDKLSANLDISNSYASSNFRNGLLWALVAEDANADTPVLDGNVSINYQLNGLNLPDLGFNQADEFIDIDKVMVSKYGIYPYVNTDELDAVRLDFKYLLESDIFSSIEFGMRHSDREYRNDRSVYEFGADNSFSSAEPPLKLTEDMVEVVDWKGDFDYFPSYLAIDIDKALNAWFPDGVPQPQQTWGSGAPGVVNPLEGSNKETAWSVLQSGTVFETVSAGYLMANIDTYLMDIPVTGNLGVRVVKSKQSATTLEDVGGDPLLGAQNIKDQAGYINENYAPGIKGIEYTDYLPQLNLNFQLTDQDQVRFAVADVMSRPPIHRLSSNTSYTIGDDGLISATSTNSPDLKPFYATQYDLSYERYFNETDGALVVALFMKDIDSTGITTITIPEYDFAGNGFNVPEYVENDDGVRFATRNGDYSVAFNDQNGGYVRGLEFAYTQVFSMLPQPFDGLGLSFSYSYTESEIEKDVSLGSETINIPLEGLSKNVSTTTLFYEYQGFDTRLSVRSRDKFVSDQVAVEAQTVFFDGETVVDYQASYKFDEQLSVLFQANNLTDAPTRSYFGIEEKTGTLQYFGRQFYLGVNYSM
ncbi:TonB-dependent receptor [Gayadomonas joobiniege]|uniref:TonB-dependent receptor n=1 Tax=Gayadomonas joobiniege TaxID=1234606 RepID=UPI0003685FC3|nr:TonB-dependent receptor [Gayadomonas joobiniege]